MKTTKEEYEEVKRLIKYLKKMNSEGRVKILEVDTKAESKEVTGIKDISKLGRFIDIALYEGN